METKVCNKCNIEKPVSEFYLRKDTGKYRNVCRACRHKPYPESENDKLFKEHKRRCKICEEIKDLNEFYFRKEIQRYRLECKKCLLKKQSKNKTRKEKVLKFKEKKEKQIIEEPKRYICKSCNVEKDIKEFRETKNKNKDCIVRHFRICYECEKKKNNERHFKRKLQDPKKRLKYEVEQENLILKKQNKKKCLICLQVKDLSEYYFRQDINNYRLWCKECEKRRTKSFYTENKEEVLQKQRQYYKDNRKLMLERKKEYADTHKEQLRLYHTKYVKDRRRNDEIFKFKSQIRHLINMSFRRQGLQKWGKTEEIVGCDLKYLREHLLKTYKKNYGYEWNGKEEVHIDHIKPLATAKNEEEILKLCHYTNLQLLKAKDNIDKKDKTDWKLKK